MKQYINLTLLLLSSTYVINAQFVDVYEKTLLFDSLSIQELEENGILSDRVYDEGKTIFLEYIHEGITKQYYKSSDSTFYFRSFYKGKSYESGKVLILKSFTSQVDTFYTFCFPQERIIRRKFHVLKHGAYNKETPGGEEYWGEYFKGKKVGVWKKRDFRNEMKETEYLNGEEISLVNPYSFEAVDYLKLLQNKRMEVSLNKEILEIGILDFHIKDEDYIYKSDHIRYQASLNAKNLLTISSISKKDDEIKIEGEWNYFANVFKFNINGNKIDFEIESIGKTSLKLKRKN